MFISRRTSLPALLQRKHGRNMTRRSWWPSRRVLECSLCLIWRQTWNNSQICFIFTIWNISLHRILQEVIPSASSILGMSRYFSATSKAVLRLPMGSSCKGRHTQEEIQWKQVNKEKKHFFTVYNWKLLEKTVNHIPLIMFILIHFIITMFECDTCYFIHCRTLVP